MDYRAKPGQSYRDHVGQVRALATKFASNAGLFEDVLHASASLHDLGKLKQGWQEYIQEPNDRKSPGHIEEGVAAALLEARRSRSDMQQWWKTIAFSCFCHHSVQEPRKYTGLETK